TAVVIAAIGIELAATNRRIVHVGAIGGAALTGTVSIRIPRIRVRMHVEEIVGTDRELELVGDVIPGFHVGQEYARLRNEEAPAERGAAGGAGVLVDRSPIGFAQREPELVERPIGGDVNLR